MIGTIFDIQRFSLHNGPGIRTTAFLKGCPLECSWCHNPSGKTPMSEVGYKPARCTSCRRCVGACDHVTEPGDTSANCNLCGRCVQSCPSRARVITGRPMEPHELVDELERDRPFFERSDGGVTFSGGEPFGQSAFLFSCLELCVKRKLQTAVDTCGIVPTEDVLSAATLIDLFLFDLKHPDPERHRELTGLASDLVVHNLRMLDEIGAHVWVRIPLIAAVNDSPEHARAFGTILSTLRQIRRVHLLPHHSLGTKNTNWGAPSETRINSFAAILADRGMDVRIGG